MKVNSKPLISVIVPCYNYGRFLSDALTSVMQQSYSEWECIIIDDGSTDLTREVSDEFLRNDCRFRYLYQQNRGVSSARNHALREARGTFVNFLDADDLLEKNKLEEHVGCLLSDPEVDLVYGDWDYFSVLDGDENPVRAVPPNQPWKSKSTGICSSICRDLIKGNFLAISAPLVRKALLDRVCGFDETLRLHEDWDLWLRCVLTGGCIQYHEAPVTMTLIRLHQNSISRNLVGMNSTSVEVRTKTQRILSDPSLIALNTKLLSEALIHYGLDELKRGSFVSGCRQLMTGLMQGGSNELWKLVKSRVNCLKVV